MSTSNPLQLCPACGATNQCALSEGRPPETCWCWQQETRLPMPMDPGACFCQRCFERLVHEANRNAPHDR